MLAPPHQPARHSKAAFPLPLFYHCSGATALYERRLYFHKADTPPYRLLLSKNYDAIKSYPLLFFHAWQWRSFAFQTGGKPARAMDVANRLLYYLLATYPVANRIPNPNLVVHSTIQNK